jgi:ferric-dicitrate binding protein FerR (iron transport regulator)
MKLPSRHTGRRSSTGFKSTHKVRRLGTFLIAVTLLNLSLPSVPGVIANPRLAAGLATGVIQVAGTVTIDGAKGTSGQTIFPGSQIHTSPGSESIIDLGKFTRLRLSAETEFTLDFSRARVSSTLDKGTVRGFIPAGFPVNIRTAGGELVTDPSQPAEFIVQVVGDITKISVDKGRVELRIKDKLQTVSAGEVFTTATGSQTKPDEDDGLTNRQKIGIFGAIGAAAVILAVALTGKKEEEPEFGGCVIILSGEGNTCR